jgi:hypothetical protein
MNNTLQNYNIYYIFFNIYFIFIIEPLGEWGFHKVLHLLNNKIHNNHHMNHRNNIVSPEAWPIIFTILSLYYNYIYLSLAFFKYWVFHTLIHFKPELIPSLANHHILHHKKQKYNFCVSAIWPDKLFKTYNANF